MGYFMATISFEAEVAFKSKKLTQPDFLEKSYFQKKAQRYLQNRGFWFLAKIMSMCFFSFK